MANEYEVGEAADMKWSPMGDRLFLRVSATSEGKTAGGIILPETRRDIVLDAEVIAVGPEVEVLRPGDQVLKVEVLGVDVGARRGVVARHPELEGVHVVREHEVTAARGAGLAERAAAARARGVSIGQREPSRSGRW